MLLMCSGGWLDFADRDLGNHSLKVSPASHFRTYLLRCSCTCKHMACCYLHQLCHCFVRTVRCLTPAVCKSNISTVDRCHSCRVGINSELCNRQIRELAGSAALMILGLLKQLQSV